MPLRPGGVAGQDAAALLPAQEYLNSKSSSGPNFLSALEVCTYMYTMFRRAQRSQTRGASPLSGNASAALAGGQPGSSTEPWWPGPHA